MERSCPITLTCVDERAARVNAALVFVLWTAFLLFPSPVIAGVLTLDFLVRGFLRPAWSPLAWTARRTLALCGIEPRPVNAGPKQFAARIGCAISAVAFLCSILWLPAPATIAAGIIAACALLEAAGGFCVGCWLYGMLHGGKA